MVWPYGELQGRPQVDDSSGYGTRWVAEALQAGFVLLGWAPDLKGSRYQLSYAFLIAPERNAIAIVGVGRIFGMPLRGTWIHTPSIDGRHAWYSTDNQACVEVDISGCWKSQLARATRFTELWRKHLSWIQRSCVTPHSFKELRELAEFRQFREDHFREMSTRRLIAFINDSETHWRYTLFGAMKLAALNYSVGLLRAISFGRIPRGA